MRFAYHPFISPVLAVAVLLSILPLNALVQGTGFLWESALVVGLGGLTGLFLGLLRTPRPLIPLVQVAGMAAVVVWRGLGAAPGAAADATWPERLRALWDQGMLAVAMGEPPIAPDPGIVWVIAGMAGLLLLLTEILASHLEQPAWSLAPLALPYLVSALSMADDLGVPQLAVVALSFLLVLAVTSGGGDGHLVRSASRVGANRAARGVQALALGVVAVLLASLAAPLVPLGQRLNLGSGSDGPIELADPTVELSHSLQRPDASPVLTYRSSSPQGSYLRTVALTKLDARGMHLMPMSLSSIGLDLASGYPGEPVAVEVQMAGVASEYLPVPFAVDAFEADGSWGFDPATMSVIGTGRARREQTMGLAYTARSTSPAPTPEELAQARAGQPQDAALLLGLPPIIPEVAALTAQVVGEAGSDGQKALAIQSFLRSSAFTYSLEAPESVSGSTIAGFLLDSRSGYCIHFATAMITMARLEGIPARMAIGFTPGTPQPDGSFVVTSHDMHAWPELYFEDLGWVPFEPTPGGTTPPEVPGAEEPGEATASPTPSPSAAESTPPAPPPDESEPDPEPTVSPTLPGDDGAGVPGWLFAMLGGVLILLIPAGLRWGIGAWRLRLGQPADRLAEAVLAEIRATFADTGRDWPPGSPVLAAEEAASGLGPETAQELREIAGHVERVRYARTYPDVADLPARTRGLRSALRRGATPPARRPLSVLWPRSLSPLRLLRKR
ncbi:MAG TPA: DUF3488 and transglutaminase-like domain-containing protein [Arachnia sp.]|nr:DUF3488 and transglutaminase-like domain-containing protein [Arachnia sp.]HMT86327.1 DUF3488 and transglutaminase-like domain-containing protein [Arachnia sp.]